MHCITKGKGKAILFIHGIKFDSGHFTPLERSTEVSACLKKFFAANRAGVTLPAAKTLLALVS
ncbi:hypothetical protein HDF16_001644 [Granulicella aggregans]|uniref:Alpha/beta hydrolase n=1 Tax=Granulicella aggregans TaxID=474949 RepID=A0A7W8E384_9BACT|nr:hypothetical protein [Granulicella aggregans]